MSMSTTFRHSLGLVLIDADTHPDNKDFSFQVAKGKATELYGWGRRGGTLPEVEANGPQAPNVHTVYVKDFTAGTRKAVLELAAEHRERYGDVRLWAWPQRTTALARWVEAGAPADWKAADVKEAEREAEEEWVTADE